MTIGPGGFRYFARAEWGAKHGRGAEIREPVDLVIVHHSYRPDLPATASEAEEARAMRGIERYHAVDMGWAGFAYGWGACQSGRIYEGRGFGYRGAHTEGKNGVSLGIVLLIDGNVHHPTHAAMGALRSIIRVGVAEGHIAPHYRVRGHGDFSTAKACPGLRCCPGNRVYPLLPELEPAGSHQRTVAIGDRGSSVRLVQEALRVRGYSLDVDGEFGGETDSAVRAFQLSQSLFVDGVVGPDTWGALLRPDPPDAA